MEREEKDWGKTQAKAVECCRETRRVKEGLEWKNSRVEQRMSRLAVLSVAAGHSHSNGYGERERERQREEEVVGREEE